MLKATIKSSYRKAATGKQVFVYTVTGTAKELAEFAAAKAEGQGLSLDEFTAKRIANGGDYLHHITPDATRGIRAEKTCNLVVTTNGNVVVDNTMQAIDRQDKVEEISIQNEGRILAEAKLGLVKLGQFNNTGVSAPAAPAAPAAPETPANPPAEIVKDEVEQTVLELQNAENAGAETLDQ